MWIPLTLAAAVLTVVVVAVRAPSAPSAVPQPQSEAATPVAPSRPARSYYAAPRGTPSNEGSQEKPLDLATALSSQSPLQPGDTLWLRGGVYRGPFISKLAGLPSAPIYVKVQPGERAILDGAASRSDTLLVSGSDVWFWGFEVTNSDQSRVFDSPSQGETRRATGINVAAPRTRLINLVVHDAFAGVSVSENAENTEIYGCLIYDNGIQEPHGGVGHGLYLSPEGVTQAIDVVTFNNQGRGINAAWEHGTVGGLVFDGLVSFNNGQSFGADVPYKLDNLFVEGAARQLTLTNSHLYHAPGTTGQNLNLVNRQGAGGTLAMSGNAVVGGSVSVSLTRWRRASVTGNRFHARSSPNPKADQTLAKVQAPADAATAYRWNENRYIDETTNGYAFLFNEVKNSYGGANLDYNDWQSAARFDGQSQYLRERPTGVQVSVRPNRYEPGRGHVVVYNWDAQPTVEVSLEELGLAPGDLVEVLDVADVVGTPVVAERYAGKPITIPMMVAADRARSGLAIEPPHTKPEFGVFLVRKGSPDTALQTTP